MLNIQLATKYSRAIFELAQEENKLDAYDKDLSQIQADVFSLPDAVKFFQNPLIPHQAKKDLLKKAFDKEISPDVMNFLLLLVDKNRIGRYLSEYKDMTDILSKLNTQRDKILAHNDKNRQHVLDTCKMCVNDIDKLYRFVYKIIRFVRQHLSYDFKYDNILNTNDVENVKMCLEQGLMYGNLMSKSKE